MSALGERRAAGKPLTRAEIGVLLAHAKLALAGDLVASDVVDDPALAAELVRYFPKRMQTAWRREIETHRLRREIIATVVANSMINRGGPTYLVRVVDRAAASPPDIARAYLAVRDAFALRDLNEAIDALDGRIGGALQLDLYRAVQDLVLTRTAWFLENVSFADGLGAVIRPYGRTIAAVGRFLAGVIPKRVREAAAAETARLAAAGVPEALAERIALLPTLAAATDIHVVAEATRTELKRAASVFFEVERTISDRRDGGVGRDDPARRSVRCPGPRSRLGDDRRRASQARHRRDRNRSRRSAFRLARRQPGGSRSRHARTRAADRGRRGDLVAPVLRRRPARRTRRPRGGSWEGGRPRPPFR